MAKIVIIVDELEQDDVDGTEQDIVDILDEAGFDYKDLYYEG